MPPVASFDIENDEELDSLVKEANGCEDEGPGTGAAVSSTRRKRTAAVEQTTTTAAGSSCGSCRRLYPMLMLAAVAAMLVASRGYNFDNNGGSMDNNQSPSSSGTDFGTHSEVVRPPPPPPPPTPATVIEPPAQATSPQPQQPPEPAQQPQPEPSQQQEIPDGSNSSVEDNGDSAAVVLERPGYKRLPRQYSESYVRRRQPIPEQARAQLVEQWGQWNLADSKARPSEDFFATYPNRDIPNDHIPVDAWQVDQEYLSQFLDEGIALVERAQEAILGEYGHSKFDEPELTFEERSKMFSLRRIDLATEDVPKMGSHGDPDSGWTTERSYQALIRRLLHAVISEDS